MDAAHALSNYELGNPKECEANDAMDVSLTEGQERALEHLQKIIIEDEKSEDNIETNSVYICKIILQL